MSARAGHNSRSAEKFALAGIMVLVANLGVSLGASTDGDDWIQQNRVEVARHALVATVPAEDATYVLNWHLVVRILGAPEEMIELARTDGVVRAKRIVVEDGGVKRQLQALVRVHGQLSISEASAGLRVSRVDSSCPALTRLALRFEKVRFRLLPPAAVTMDSVGVDLEVHRGLGFDLSVRVDTADPRLPGDDDNLLTAWIAELYRTVRRCEESSVR